MSASRARARLLVDALGEATRWLDGGGSLARAVADLEAVWAAPFGLDELRTAWSGVMTELEALEDDACGGPFLVLVHEDMRTLGHPADAAAADPRDLDLCLALAVQEMHPLVSVTDGWNAFVEASAQFAERAADARPDPLELWWLSDALHTYLAAVADRRGGSVTELLCTWLRERPSAL